jgi:sugar/nucleoside kinase (ribokinase family)
MAEGGVRRGVITGGTWCADRNKLVERWPAEDSIVEVLEADRHNGGSASNLAFALKKLDPGFFVETIGIVGDDDDGHYLLAAADAAGIVREQIKVTREAATNYTDCFASKATGKRTHIFEQGASALMTPEDFDFARTGGRILHLGLPGVHRILDAPWGGEANGWVAVLRKARAAGIETNMELASLPAETIARLVRPCLPHLDLLIVNDTEIGALAGMATLQDGRTRLPAVIEAVGRVMEAGAMTIVAAHFPGGAVALTRGGERVVKPSVRAPAAEVVGANGAGDAFAAGMIHALHEGCLLEEAVTRGHASAAASLRAMSTTGGIVGWRECLALADRWGWREAV